MNGSIGGMSSSLLLEAVFPHLHRKTECFAEKLKNLAINLVNEKIGSSIICTHMHPNTGILSLDAQVNLAYLYKIYSMIFHSCYQMLYCACAFPMPFTLIIFVTLRTQDL